jgi:HEAT repeats
MPKLSIRRGVWIAVALLAVVVLSGSAYLLTRKHPTPSMPVLPPNPHARFDVRGEEQRAKTLPEHAELQINAKEDRPLNAAAVARLGELARHSNWWIRMKAVGALGNAPDPLRKDAADRVAPHLKDEVPFVRYQAMDALARLEAKDRIPELAAFLKSDDSDERANAKRALRRLGHPAE